MAEINIEKMAQRIAKKAIQELRDNGVFVSRWIPVSERLPEEYKTVIASTEYGVYPEARYSEEDGWAWAYESGADYWEELAEVKAWMPLPEPYKAESEAEDGNAD